MAKRFPARFNAVATVGDDIGHGKVPASLVVIVTLRSSYPNKSFVGRTAEGPADACPTPQPVCVRPVV